MNRSWLCIPLLVLAADAAPAQTLRDSLAWEPLPPLPGDPGVAGPLVGVHNDALLVAGGANFPHPVWESEKVWRDEIRVLVRTGEGTRWIDGGTLNRPLAYGAAVSTPHGVLCVGGNDSARVYADAFLLRWDPESASTRRVDLPPLPQPCVYAQAVRIGELVYIVGGQTDHDLASATRDVWTLDLAAHDRGEAVRWRAIKPIPGPPRAFHLAASQHNGYEDCLYVISGRRSRGESTEFLRDVWEYAPSARRWRRRADTPRCVMAAAAASVGQSHIMVFGGADGSLFARADALRDDHPGFASSALAYHTITDTWTEAGEMPQSQVTTAAVWWDGGIVIPSGEVRPRVRTREVWRVRVATEPAAFGLMNHLVLVGYLASMVGVGLYFARKNKDTNDYFRGGQTIAWWAAGCSIFATMLSSLTFTGVPSKAYAQDWVYAVGNFMIPVVAVVAVYVALPFYRRIDATSAYEYLERRFNRTVRWFGSLSFSLFHLFRMAVVMSLTGLALAVATPLSPAQSVLIIGGLSLVYCTMGGIEAVVWTDTIQTVVLGGGAIFALVALLAGVDGGLSGFWQTAASQDKVNLANLRGRASGGEIVWWVFVLGGIGQNFSSYTADQAVVQRYMTTATPRLAARSIWTNAILSVPATLIFFTIGTALFAFYRSHPEKLDPTMNTDQIFPLFIANEMPIGLAGLMVAAIFAAAQSTVSTSMNSTATTLVTDLLRPLGICHTERGYLRAARVSTFSMGVAGTLLGLLFVDPDILSRWDAYIAVIGLFMGVLGGLFLLGALTRRGSAAGALVGAATGVATMIWVWLATDVHPFLYTVVGIASCFVAGYLASLLMPRPIRDLSGLTLLTLRQQRKVDPSGH